MATRRTSRASAREYEEQIRAAGGIDLQVLGIGTDGHIGFNEPTSSLASRTRIKTLTQQTRADNARFFGSEEAVPHHVITMGIGTIMEARQNLLLAFGADKARAIAEAVEGPITSINPASILQMHPVVKVCLDEAGRRRTATGGLLPLGLRQQTRLAEILRRRVRMDAVPSIQIRPFQ